MRVLYDFLKQPACLDFFTLPGRPTEHETRLLRVIQGDVQAILNNRITAFEFADQAALESAEEALTDCAKQARELGYTLFIDEDITGYHHDRAYIVKE